MSETNHAVAEGNTTPLLSSVISALSTDATAFTGERFVFGSGVEIFYEHYHRYVFAARSVKSDETVLDLGCGIGYGSLLLASKAKKVISLDRDADSITLLRSLAEQLDIKNIEPICGDVASVASLISTRIDVVICHELIEHLPQSLQESLVSLIGSGAAPFHAKTRFLVSTPERATYNEKNRSHNDFHEFEFSYEEFKRLLSNHFKGVSLYWQGGVTGNVIIAEESRSPMVTAGFVQWQNSARLLGTVGDTPTARGVYMYAIASNSESTEAPPSSVLIDQKELLFMEKLAIAAQELNEQNRRLVSMESEVVKHTTSNQLLAQAQEKIKALMRENEMLGARLEETHRYFGQRIEDYESVIKAHVTAPLEVKLARKCVEKLPNFVRKILRRIAAVGLALVRG